MRLITLATTLMILTVSSPIYAYVRIDDQDSYGPHPDGYGWFILAFNVAMLIYAKYTGKL